MGGVIFYSLILDYIFFTDRLFLRRATFIKISEAIVDVECSEIFNAVISECNKLPNIGFQFTYRLSVSMKYIIGFAYNIMTH